MRLSDSALDGRSSGRILPFAKVEALGNDFVWILRAVEDSRVGAWARLTPQLCHRHTGIGADGVILWDGDRAWPKLWFLNADGSVAEACGNGLRAVAVGGKTLGFWAQDRLEFQVGERSFPVVLGQVPRVGLSAPRLEPLPGGIGTDGLLVFVPNPHLVIFDSPPAHADMPASWSALVPGGANVGFCATAGRELVLRVWERGVGWTLSCATGAAAAAAAALRLGKVEREPVVVRQPGGPLSVWHEEGRAWVEGPADLRFVGWWPEEGVDAGVLAHAIPWDGRV